MPSQVGHFPHVATHPGAPDAKVHVNDIGHSNKRLSSSSSFSYKHLPNTRAMTIQILDALPANLTMVVPSADAPSAATHFDLSNPSLALVRHHQPNTSLDISPSLVIAATNTQIGGLVKGDIYIAQKYVWRLLTSACGATHEYSYTRFLATSKIYFASAAQLLAVDYLSIIVHAISRSGDRVVNKPHIYCQLDENAGNSIIDKDGNQLSARTVAGGEHDERKADDEEGEEPVTFELRIVPDDSDSCTARLLYSSR